MLTLTKDQQERRMEYQTACQEPDVRSVYKALLTKGFLYQTLSVRELEWIVLRRDDCPRAFLEPVVLAYELIDILESPNAILLENTNWKTIYAACG